MMDLASTLSIQNKKTSQEDYNRMLQNLRPEVQHYNHNMSTDGIDKMDKHLQSMKDALLKNRVRCHMLQVDLATQFSPEMQEVLRNTTEVCSKCVESLKTIETGLKDTTTVEEMK